MLKNIIDLVQDFCKSVLYHTPKEKLNELEVKKIKQNGLVHFCEKEKISNILKEGVRCNLKKPMKKTEKNYTWYYIYETTTYEEKKKIIRSKGERKNNDAYIIIKELTDEQMNLLRIRRKYDNAVIFPGTLKTESMKSYII